MGHRTRPVQGYTRLYHLVLFIAGGPSFSFCIGRLFCTSDCSGESPFHFLKKPKVMSIMKTAVCFGQHAVCFTLEGGAAHYESSLPSNVFFRPCRYKRCVTQNPYIRGRFIPRPPAFFSASRPFINFLITPFLVYSHGIF